jgi:uncharacterized protein YndB with AHSA1/START domain
MTAGELIGTGKMREHMSALAHRLDRTIVINAPREAVFRYFTDSSRWANWWGAGSTIDSRPGGRICIKYPEGTEVSGEVIEVHPPERIVFTYGYVSGNPIPAGSSRVTIQLAAERGATRLTLTHELSDAAIRDQHIQGWRYQLSLFSNVVADEINAGAAAACGTARVRCWRTSPSSDLTETSAPAEQTSSSSGRPVRSRRQRAS